MLKTVRVPASIEGPFAEAEEIVSRYFRDRRDDPSHGTIEIFGERYVLVRGASLSVEFFRLVHELYGEGREREADEFAHNILFDLAHTIGKSDARNFHQKMGLMDPIARLSAGPIHFAHAGWAFVDIFPESKPSPDEDYFLVYDHPYSFESDAWIRAGRRTDFAACIMNAGYSSGWCEESFGVELVATEIECRARGDEHCRFVMAHPKKIEALVEKYRPARGIRIPDFFARKRIEEELRRARDELELRVEERTAELRESTNKLAQAHRLEAVGRLAGGIAHDFNNLMAVILGNAGLAAKQIPHDHPAATFLHEISAAGERAANLTRQLLAFSRAQPRAPEELDVNRLVKDLARMLERLIGDDVTLNVELGAQVGLVAADRAQIEQVAVNLVVNARDAMPTGGVVSIETTEVEIDEAQAKALGVMPGTFVQLSVSDAGAGMAEEVASHVFDPFFTTKEAGKGTGLGLSTVYGIAKQSGGAVTLVTAPGEGARFNVLFPRVREKAESVPRMPANAAPIVRGSETILLVEDQASLREVVGKMLRDAGYAVIETSDPSDAERIAHEHGTPIHLLLTDVVMPNMTGPQLALRLLVDRPHLRVLYMSGYTGSSHDLATSLLNKPFRAEELTRRVREALDEP